MTYKLRKLDAKSIKATERAWRHDLVTSPDIFPGDVSHALRLAHDHSNYEDTSLESFAYGIFEDEHHVSDSVVEVIVSKSAKKLIKMLDCFVRPSITERAFRNDIKAMDKVVGIYAEAIIGTMQLGIDQQVSVVKFYGRSQSLLGILGAVGIALQKSTTSSYRASIEGRWLVVQPAKRKKST